MTQLTNWLAITAALSCRIGVAGPGFEAPVVRDVAFEARCDGSEQRYVLWYSRAGNTDVSHDVLIALHGHGSDRWQFIKDGRDECRGPRFRGSV